MRRVLHRASTLAAADAGHWGSSADLRHPKTGGGSTELSEPQTSGEGSTDEALLAASSTRSGDGERLCAALRKGLRDVLLSSLPPRPSLEMEPAGMLSPLATGASAAATAAVGDSTTDPAWADVAGDDVIGAAAVTNPEAAENAATTAMDAGYDGVNTHAKVVTEEVHSSGATAAATRSSSSRPPPRQQALLQQQSKAPSWDLAAWLQQAPTAATDSMALSSGLLFSSGSSRESVPVPLRPQREARRRRRLAAAASGDAAVVRKTELQARLQLYDEALNEMHRVAQVGFVQEAGRSSPVAAARRAASMRRALESSKLPQQKQPGQQRRLMAGNTTDEHKPETAGLASTLSGAESANKQQLPLESLLGLNEVQSQVLAQQAGRRAAASASSSTADDATTTDATADATDGAAGSSGGGGLSGGLQSRMTERWWGSLSSRIQNRQQQTAESTAETTPTAIDYNDFSAPKIVYTSVKSAKVTSTTTSTSSTTPGGTGNGTTTSPYLGPDVAPPALSLSDLDLEMSGDGAAGRPQDHMFSLLQPMLGPSFEGMGRDLAGLTRNMWAALDAVSGSQQVQSWLDIVLEMLNSVAQAPAVCTASDLRRTLIGTRDMPGQWAAAATLRGRGGAALLQMYRSILQTHLIRQLRQLALQVEMTAGAPSRALTELDAALRNASALAVKEPVAGLLQQVFNAVKSTELASLPNNATEAATAAAAAVSPTATATQASRFGSNIQVSDRKTATVYYTLTTRSHAHVLRNLSQGLVATVQVPLPRQTKYFDVRLRGVAVRVLADKNSSVTVQHRTAQVAAPNHAYLDGLGVDMLRACASSLSLPSEDADVAVAAKGPISLYYPDPVAALMGRSVTYNHPVPASYCNVFCPSMGAPTSYVPADGAQSAGLGASLFSPYGSWLLQYRPRAGQAGFVNITTGDNINASDAVDCLTKPCTYFRAEALQLEFNVSYREILSTAFLGSKSSDFFSSPAGEDSDALAAGLLPTSPNTTDPFTPSTKLTNQLTPLADLCSYRTANNSMRPLTALNASYTTITPLALVHRRTGSTSENASFRSSYTIEPSSQVSVSATLDLSGLNTSLQESLMQGNVDPATGLYVYDSDRAKILANAVRSYMFNGPAAGVGRTLIREVIVKAAAAAANGRRRRAAASTFDAAGSDDAAAGADTVATDSVVLEPVTRIRGCHWHSSSREGTVGTAQQAAAAGAANAPLLHAGKGDGGGGDGSGGGDGVPVTGHARLAYRRRRRQLGSVNEVFSVVVTTSELDVVSGNQASGLLNNGDRAESALQEALRAHGIDVSAVNVASVRLVPGDANQLIKSGKKKLSRGAIAGIVVGSVVGAIFLCFCCGCGAYLLSISRSSSKRDGPRWHNPLYT
ncbi:hypothetical protein PLESTB_001502400 [Pleodorina starrii]|uniref:Transmembrane protein n=1 Tax=Pleodorina starrii TaxID=330485 RepID=A0A9W6F7V7_9CHLO|nr:hypothetical protein PLESTB_001502400 [Pleodorina starrii]